MIFLDFETKSEVNLVKKNPWVYSEGKEADILCLAYAVNGGPVEIWEPGMNIPECFNSIDRIVAHNALFEHAIFTNIAVRKYGFPEWLTDPKNYICTASMARSCNLPGSLEPVAQVLNVKNKKLDMGKKLIQKYCLPKKDRKTGEQYFNKLEGQDKIDMFKYNEFDVLATREVFDILKNVDNCWTDFKIFQSDFIHNIQGLRVDVESLDKIIDFIEVVKVDILKEMEGRFPGLLITSNKQLLKFLSNRGHRVDNVQAATLQSVVESTKNQDVKDVLEARNFLSKASLKKFTALKDLTSSDARVRHFLKYYGAHTGRYSGKGFQPHNLPKSDNKSVTPIEEIVQNKDDMTTTEIIQALKKLVATMIIPEDGNKFIAGDFSAIEARVLVFLAGEEQAIKAYQENQDAYIKMASKIFKVAESTIEKKSKERQLGKAAILGCGYGMGAEKFMVTCNNSGVDIDFKLAEFTVKTYRDTYSKVTKFWYELENKFKAVIKGSKSEKVGLLSIEKGKNFVKIKLPNGRCLYYHKARICNGQLEYWNYQRGCYVKLWGGILTENVVQAVSRDLLCECMFKLESSHNLPVRLHVHDEIVIEVPENGAEENKIIFDKVTNEPPSWFTGFPLETESEILDHYVK